MIRPIYPKLIKQVWQTLNVGKPLETELTL